MPLRKQQFTEVFDNLPRAIDIDDNVGRSVPTNMNFIEEGFLIKDTGYVAFGGTPTANTHSPFYYKKKNGDTFFIRVSGDKLQQYSYVDKKWYDISNSPTFTVGAKMGYIVYDDELWFGNAVESLHKWDGTTFTEYASAPKGNILEIFEDRLCVSGVTAEPLTVYYSNVGVPQTFSVSDVLNPLGTDSVTDLVNYYGTLLIFKKNSIWKLTFVYDQVVSLFVPKLELQSGNYGACSLKATTWVENDIWFFTGREVRSIGYKDQQIGILGVNTSVISEQIKETLEDVAISNFSKVVVFYHERRFYLTVPLSSDDNDTMFVCHTLYSNSWTKYTGREKARAGDAVIVDDVIYTANQNSPYGIIKWTVDTADSQDQNYYLTTES